MLTIEGLKIFAIVFTAGANFILGILVFNRNPKHQINRTFFLFCFFIAIWALSLLFYEFPIFLSSLFWIKATYLLVSIAIVFLFRFSFVFPVPIKNKSLIFAPISSAIFITATFTLLFFSDIWIQHVGITIDRGLQTTLGPGYLIWSTMIWIEFGWTLFNFISNRHRLTGIHRAQLLYLFLGFGLWGVFVTIPDIIIPVIFKDTRYFSISAITSLFFTFAVAYTILRHRFLDIRLIVARSVVFTLSFAILGSLYTAGLFFVGNYILKTSTDTGNLVISTALALIVAFSFHPLKRYLEKITDDFFFKGKYNSQVLLGDLSRIMASTALLSELKASVLGKLLSEMKIDFGSLVLLKNQSNFSVKETGEQMDVIFEDLDLNYLINEARKNLKENLLIFEEIQDESEEKKIMRKYAVSVVLPLIVKDETLGVILLGNKSSGEIYSVEDIEVLKILTPEISIAVKNTLSYEEIKRFNITLKEEVEKATKELKIANEKLQELDKLKDEFVSIASHELRTPMTVIKSYIWLLLNDKEEKLSEKQAKHLNITYDSVERLIKLVNDMLDVSRIESGRIVLTPAPTDIEKLAQDVIAEMLPKAQEEQIDLSLEKGSDPLPQVFVDPDKTKEVLINLIGNSLKFTPRNGRIKISLAKKDGMIEASISDTGEGMKEEDIPKLFQKFGIVANNYPTKQDVQGTGLGLYISKSIIELQGGKMWAKSEGENKGSTFSFTLKVTIPVPVTS